MALTDLENAKSSAEERLAAVMAELAALDATKAGGKPNAATSGIDHLGYKRGLLDEAKTLREQIKLLRELISEETDGKTWEVVSEADTW